MSEAAPSLFSALRRQLDPCVAMLRAGIVSCDHAHWDVRSGSPPFWEQAYHTVFWMAAWLRDWSKPFVEPPFHVPEALGFQGEPSSVIARADLLRYLDDTRADCGRWLDGLTDDVMLAPTMAFGKPWTPVDRILGQVRHVQHHSGYLNAALRFYDLEPAGWVGFQEG